MAKILIIDDEVGFCEAFSALLRGKQHEVDAVLDPREGIEKVRTKSYDLIFLDVLMPKLEGRQVLEEIQKICQTPVVIMSGYLPVDKDQDILRAGAFGSLRKPLESKQVFDLVEKALKQQNKN